MQNGLERLVLPRANQRIAQNAIRIHKEGTTLISRLAHKMLLLYAFSGILTLMPGAHVGYPKRLQGFNLERWLDLVSERLGHKHLYASVSFPPKVNENRFVAFLMGESGQSIGFAKVSRDDYTDQQILTEMAGLQKMSEFGPDSFSAPTVLDLGIYDHHQYLILEPFLSSTKCRTIDAPWRLEQILREMAEQYKEKAPVDCSWWDRLETKNDATQLLVEIAHRMRNQEIPVALSHGDFGAGNTYHCGDKIYLFDWEEFCGDAPRFTDWFFYVLPPVQFMRNRIEEVGRCYDAAYGRIRSLYPEVTHWDLGLALLLLSTRRNWVVSPEMTKMLSETIYIRCQQDENKH